MRKLRMVQILMLANLLLLTSALPRAADPRRQETTKESASPRIYEDRDGYQLLSLVLNNEAKTSKLKRLEVYGRTAAVSVPFALCSELPEEFQSAADDLASKSKTELQFRRGFSINHPYQLTPFYGATDFGISAVGFDLPKTHAVASVVRGCGSLCSNGSTYLFRKTKEGWQQVAQICKVTS